MKQSAEIRQRKVFNNRTGGNRANHIEPLDRAVHEWYRFVLSYPPHLVRRYITDFDLNEASLLLDPFCGTGTTLVEAKLQGIPVVGLDANYFAHFASTVKTNWRVDAKLLMEHSICIAEQTLAHLYAQGIDDETDCSEAVDNINIRKLPTAPSKLLLGNSISPIPLHKTLVLLDMLYRSKIESILGHQLLALANALVFNISNLQFGPEVGVGIIKRDTPVVSTWLKVVKRISKDLSVVQHKERSTAMVQLRDSRDLTQEFPDEFIDGVITSPPYPNEKDYTRTTRLESVILGFISSRDDLRTMKKTLIRSNTRNVYKNDDDYDWVRNISAIQTIAEEIESRRVQLAKTSGFERLYGKVTKLYFGGIARHLESLMPKLKPGAKLAYVVGDQASYLRVMIRTGQIVSEIAHSLGYRVEGLELFRTRFSTATKQHLREEVVILNKPGASHAKHKKQI